MDRPAPASVTLSALLVGMVALLTLLAVGRLRAARREGEALASWRVGALLGAPLLTAAVCLSPLDTLGAHYLMTAHLVQVTVLMGFVPPLLLLGVAGWRPRLARGPLRRPVRVAVHPVPALILMNVTFFAWHATPLFEACLEHEELYALQLVTLVVVSTAFWWPIVEPTGRPVMTPFIKLGYILLATVPQTFAGLLFALAHRTLYPGYATGPGAWGLSPMSDQEVAGAMMALLNKIALFAAFSVVFWRMLRDDEADNELGDDGHGGSDDRPTPVPPPTPAWLRLIDRGPVVDEPAATPTHARPTELTAR